MLDSGRTLESVVPKEQESGLVIAKSSPAEEAGAVLTDLRQQRRTIHGIERVVEVHLQHDLTGVSPELVDQMTGCVNRSQ